MTGRWTCPRHDVLLVDAREIDLLERPDSTPYGIARRVRCPMAGCSVGSRARPPRAPTPRQLGAWAWLRTRSYATVVVVQLDTAPRLEGRLPERPESKALREFARRCPEATEEEQVKFLDMLTERGTAR